MRPSDDVLAIWLRVTERRGLRPELEDRFRQSEAAKDLAMYLPYDQGRLEAIGTRLRQRGTDGLYVLRINRWLSSARRALGIPQSVFIDDYETFVRSLPTGVSYEEQDEQAREIEERRRIGEFAGPDTPDDDLRFDTWWWPAPMPYEPPE
jgi:hypothetical protein